MSWSVENFIGITKRSKPQSFSIRQMIDGLFHVVSTWNARDMFVGKLNRIGHGVFLMIIINCLCDMLNNKYILFPTETIVRVLLIVIKSN